MGGSSVKPMFATGVATTFLFGGLGLFGTLTAKKHDYNFSVSAAYDENGKKTSLACVLKSTSNRQNSCGSAPRRYGLGC